MTDGWSITFPSCQPENKSSKSAILASSLMRRATWPWVWHKSSAERLLFDACFSHHVQFKFTLYRSTWSKIDESFFLDEHALEENDLMCGICKNVVIQPTTILSTDPKAVNIQFVEAVWKYRESGILVVHFAEVQLRIISWTKSYRKSLRNSGCDALKEDVLLLAFLEVDRTCSTPNIKMNSDGPVPSVQSAKNRTWERMHKSMLENAQWNALFTFMKVPRSFELAFHLFICKILIERICWWFSST